jgi:hypothetical protein
MAKKSGRTAAGKSRRAARKKASPNKTAAKKKPAKSSTARKSKAKTAKAPVAAATPAPKPQARPSLAAPLGGAMGLAGAVGVIDQITALAAQSKIANFRWKDDSGNASKAPLGYIKGMAVVYARVYCKLKAGDPAALEMAKAKTADPARDVLAFYNEFFAAAGMNNDTSGPDTLRHLFVLLTGLGIRESSGHYCVGRFMGQNFDKADTAEAGLFQASHDLARHCEPILDNLFDHYTQNPAGFIEIFKVGISCSAADLKNWGDPGEPGFKWQQLTKASPAFAAEFAAVGLRNNRLTWGPIRKKKVEIVPDCDALFKDVQTLMDSAPGLCAQVV